MATLLLNFLKGNKNTIIAIVALLFIFITYTTCTNNKTAKLMQEQYNKGVDIGYQNALNEFRLEQEKIIKENEKTVKEIETKAEQSLRDKQKELEHEKQVYQSKLNSLQSDVNSLQNNINRIRRNNKTSITTTSPSTSSRESEDRAWNYFGQCIQEYSNLGQRTEELNNQVLEWRAYGETVNEFIDNVEKENNK